MNHYRVYGLTLRSEVPLLELTPQDPEEPDVTIRLGDVESLQIESVKTEKDLSFWIVPNRVIIVSKELGKFRVNRGREIVVEPRAGAQQQAIRSIVFDLLLPSILHQRGSLLLHASAVACGEGAIAFLGQSGAGKSTMAVAMHTYRNKTSSEFVDRQSIFTDDMITISFNSSNEPLVLPGVSQLKVLPETVAKIDYLEDKISAEIDPFTHKHICCDDSYFTKKVLPLKQIYLLTEGSQVSIEKVSPQECFLELLRNSYASALIEATDSPGLQFQQYMQLANKVSVYRLTRPRSFAMLPSLVKLVESNSYQEENV